MVVNKIRPPSNAGNGKIFIIARFTDKSAVNKKIIDTGTACSSIKIIIFPAPTGPDSEFFASSRCSGVSPKKKFPSVRQTSFTVKTEE